MGYSNKHHLSIKASMIEKESLCKHLLENIVVGVFVIKNDRVEFANAYLLNMFGYSLDEMLYLPVDKLINGEELIAIRESVRHCIQIEEQIFHFACQGIRKDGSSLYLEGTGICIMTNGQLSIHGSVQDVTYKREQEKSLMDTALLYQKITKLIPQPIVITDQGKIVFVNKFVLQAFELSDESQIVGRNVFEYIHPGHHKSVIEAMSQLTATDDVSPFTERIIIKPDGKLVDAELSSIRISNYMGRVVILSIIRDISERKQMEEMLYRSEQLSMIGQLAAGIAHEIRNPLTALKGFTKLLRTKYSDEQNYLTIMANEIDRINLIVNEFMALAKPHLSEFKHEQLEDILQSVNSVLETQAILLNIEMELRLDHPLPAVRCNADQLKQVFMNVIKNAFEAMANGGKLIIEAIIDADRLIHIRFKDNGPGIPDELIRKIGEPFITTKETGFGLGLMISKRIVETHLGTLHISSKQGEGTEVKITLPISQLPEEHIASASL